MSRVTAYIVLFGILSVSLSIASSFHQLAMAQDSEIGIVVPWRAIEKDFAQWGQSSQQTWNDELNSVTIPVDSLDVQLPKVQVAALVSGSSLQVVEGRFDFGIQKLKLKLNISGLNIDQVVERNIDGVIVRVHVKVQCSAFELQQPQAQIFASLNLGIADGKVNPRFDSFHVVWPQDSWQSSSIQCQGPAGMGERIQAELMNRLKNSEDFRPELEKLVLKKVQGEILSRVNKWSSPQLISEGSESLVVQLKEVQSSPQGLLFLSVLSDPHSPGASPVSLDLDSRTWEQVPQETPSLLVPTAGLEKLLYKRYSREPEWTSMSLNSVQAFARLLKSRFLQFFVWSDLWNYSKSSPFTLKMKRPEHIPLQWDDKGRAQADFQASAWIQSVRDGKTWNYIGLSSPVRMDLQMQIQQGQLRIGGQGRLQSFKTYVGAEYEKQYGTPWFSESIVEKSLQAAVEKVSVQLQLPALQFNDSTLYKADGWKGLDRKMILVPWVLQTKSQN